MRFSATVIALIFAVMFGVMTVLDGMTVARAGEGDDDEQTLAPTRGSGCLNDDGDDDLPPNEEPVDDPDSEDGEEGAEEGDPEDEDPYYEDDDCPQPTSAPQPGECGNQTATGLYLFSDTNYQGNCIFLPPLSGDNYWALQYICGFGECSWNDVPSSARLVGNLPNVYVCLHDPPDDGGGFCEHVPGDIPDLSSINLDNNITTIFYNGDPLSSAVPGETIEPAGERFAAADADCDGGVGVSDALTNLQHLSGFEVGCVGDWNGNAYQGDADCSGAIAAGDVTAILAAVATGSESAC
jgi:hypothetical protein